MFTRTLRRFEADSIRLTARLLLSLIPMPVSQNFLDVESVLTLSTAFFAL